MISSFRGPHRFLSNFWMAPVHFEGVIYPSTEHAFQAAKTLNEVERQYIRSCKSPTDAKRMGRKVALRPDWETAKLTIMIQLLMEKFSTHPELKKKLLATGEVELIEGNTWHDVIWGVCMCSTHRGKGKNYLGQLLMSVRTILRG